MENQRLQLGTTTVVDGSAVMVGVVVRIDAAAGLGSMCPYNNDDDDDDDDDDEADVMCPWSKSDAAAAASPCKRSSADASTLGYFVGGCATDDGDYTYDNITTYTLCTFAIIDILPEGVSRSASL
jgi:hypothetical protein